MARAQDQRRWRTNTHRKRIEVYLPAHTAEQLDVLAADRGLSRAGVIAALIDDSARALERRPPAVAAPSRRSVLEPEPAGVAEPGATAAYCFRRPRNRDERRYEWIAVTDDGRRIALGPDPARFWRWRGHYLDGSLFSRDAKGNTRDEVARNLLNLPRPARK